MAAIKTAPTCKLKIEILVAKLQPLSPGLHENLSLLLLYGQ